MRMPSRLSVPGLSLATLVLLVGLTACGGSDATEASGSVPAAAATASTEAAAPAEDDCSAAQPEINAGAQVTGFVTGVEVTSCDKAVVTTSLGNTPDDVASALGVCGIAANESSSHGVAAVSIVSSDGTELVTGTNAGDCKAAG